MCRACPPRACRRDTAGQERYHSLAPMYYRGAAAAIVVFDITHPGSFERAKKCARGVRAAPSCLAAACRRAACCRLQCAAWLRVLLWAASWAGRRSRAAAPTPAPPRPE